MDAATFGCLVQIPSVFHALQYFRVSEPANTTLICQLHSGNAFLFTILKAPELNRRIKYLTPMTVSPIVKNGGNASRTQHVSMCVH